MIGKTRNKLHRVSSSFISWRLRRSGMKIGSDCLISRTAKLDLTYPKGISIGDNTVVAFGSTILTHDFVNKRHLQTSIGSNCFIGARSIIMPGVTVGDNVIVGVGSVVLTDVPSQSIVYGNPARIVESDANIGRYGSRLKPDSRAKAEIDPEPSVAAIGHAGRSVEALVSTKVKPGDMGVAFADLGMDSFALICLRAEIEDVLGRQIDDEDWSRVETPADLIGLSGTGAAVKPRAGTAESERNLEINMPQMAMGGLSESWLFKEIGDVHWSLLTQALGVKSSGISDQAGNRLYATFTRICYASDTALSRFQENSHLRIRASMSRFGGGMYFSKTAVTSGSATIQFDVMSSFSRFGTEGDNRSLVKGQPDLPPGFPIPAAAQMPDFAAEYRRRRAEAPATPIFVTKYEIVPVHDINGVGLLYFAAYPIIAEICFSRFAGSATTWSVTGRDICYFANSGTGDELEYQLLDFVETGDTTVATSSLSRSDGVRMALIRSDLVRNAG